MEISSFRSLDELGMDDPLFFTHWPMNSFNEHNPAFFENSYSPPPVLDFKWASEPGPADPKRPSKQLKWDSRKSESLPNLVRPTSFQFLDSSFTDPVGMVKPELEEAWSSSSTLTFAADSNQNFVLTPCQGAKRISTNTRLAQSQDHILTERKRREKLSQKFVALTAIVPGLKKLDKASVLGDAIKYLKQLQDKVKILEEQTKKKSIESVVFVKKYEISVDDAENSSSDDQSFSSGPIITETLPEIEARFSNKDVLITIHCEKSKGMLDRVVAEIEKLHLSIVNSSVMSFGESSLHITVVTQKDEDFSMNMTDAVKKLRIGLKKIMGN